MTLQGILEFLQINAVGRGITSFIQGLVDKLEVNNKNLFATITVILTAVSGVGFWLLTADHGIAWITDSIKVVIASVMGVVNFIGLLINNQVKSTKVIAKKDQIIEAKNATIDDLLLGSPTLLTE